MNKKEDNILLLIPKYTAYIEYSLNMVLKLPRIEKFNIGNEYKNSMYQTIKYILYLNKIEKIKRLENLNNIDVELNLQRIYLRIMYKNRWIDDHKFKTSMNLLYEIGKILGGLIKYYGKNNSK